MKSTEPQLPLEFLRGLSQVQSDLSCAEDTLTQNRIIWKKLLEILPQKNMGLFTYDPLEEELLPKDPSLKRLKDLGCAEQSKDISEFVLYGKGIYQYKNNIHLFVFRHGIRNYGILVVNSELEELLVWGITHIIEFYIHSQEKLELTLNNSRLASSLGRSMHNLSVVLSMSNIVGKAQDIDHLLNMILNLALTSVNASRGLIMLESDHSHRMEVRAISGVNSPMESVHQGKEIPIQGTLHQRVMNSGQPAILSDHLIWDEELYGIEGNSNSIMCVPLITKELAFGVIYVTNKEGSESFEQEDLNVLSIMATYVASVLDQAKLYNLATIDELTGLYTRRFYTKRIGEEFKRANRYQRHLSLIILDIDHFKRVNDEFGHLAGDEVLRAIGGIISRTIRQEVDIGVRYGGEELAVIMPETHLKGAHVAAERLRVAIEKFSFTFEDKKIPITVSIGVSSYPENGSLVEELFNHADHALYISKSRGRNQVTLYPE